MVAKSTAAGTRGAEEIAESFILTNKQRATGPGVGFEISKPSTQWHTFSNKATASNSSSPFKQSQ